jgi:ankyrin repeat protein
MADAEQEYEGASPTQIMFHAIQASNIDLLKEILAAQPGPNLEATNAIGDSPVLACLRHDSLDALAIILEEEVDVDLENVARDGDRPLHLAVRLEDEDQRVWCSE